MSTNQPSVVDTSGASTSRFGRGRLAWVLWALALAAGVGAGAGIALLHRSHATAASGAAAAIHDVATWPAGARPAPDFRLVDEHGTPFTLRSLRGRPAIVTFIDPLCRNLCPLEAKILSGVVRQLPAAERPAIVAVSVNRWGDTPTAFADDRARWQLAPQWRWGVGSPATLASVWKDYAIGVRVTSKTIAGVTVHEVDHTEASYLVDASGHERALFVYPFTTNDVLTELRRLGGR